MGIQYYEPIMDQIEKRRYRDFVGYINTRGQLIDYSTLIGEQTHYSTKNPASMMFLQFISFIIMGFDPESLKSSWDTEDFYYKANKIEEYDDVVKRGFSYFERFNVTSYDEFLGELNAYYEERRKLIKSYLNSNEPYWNMHVYETLQNDLMSFFKKAYQGASFFKTIDRELKILSFADYATNFSNEIEQKVKLEFNYREDRCYIDYQIAELMSHFKDIMVMYMGYDSIERRLKLKNNEELKVITTSCTNPNERFYNWLLMDWNIQRIPRMLWHEEKVKFVAEGPLVTYYQTDKEEILGKEIASIKREVPKQYRKEYFRK